MDIGSFRNATKFSMFYCTTVSQFNGAFVVKCGRAWILGNMVEETRAE